MKTLPLLCLLLTPISHANQLHADPPNVLLLCVDDLRPELNCFGKSYVQSPSIDELAATGRVFHQHYVQAPTCGASRYAMLTGTYGPAGNEALFARAKQIKEHPDSNGVDLRLFGQFHGLGGDSFGSTRSRLFQLGIF